MNSSGGWNAWIKTTSITVSTLSVAASIVWAGLQATATLKALEAETDTKLMQIYITEILPEISGIDRIHLSENCLERNMKNYMAGQGEIQKKPLSAFQYDCRVEVHGLGQKQIAGYWAALELAKKYPILCQPAIKVLKSKPTEIIGLSGKMVPDKHLKEILKIFPACNSK